MDPEARLFQEQLHSQNQKRLENFERKLDRVLVTSIRVEQATKELPGLTERVEALEEDRDRAKGAMAVLGGSAGFVGAGIGAVVEALIHHFFGR